MKFIEIKTNLKQKIENAYCLFGEDSFLLQNAKKSIISACNIINPELNHLVFSNENIKIQDVIETCQTLPFMCEKKIVELNIVARLTSADISAINNYLNNPNPTTCFVVEDAVGQDTQVLLKNITLVDCTRLEEDTLLKWIGSRLKNSGKQIDVSAGVMLCEYSNYYLSKIEKELSKLVSFVGERNIITCQDIVQIVGKDFEFQIYELAEAVVKHNTVKAYQILNNLKINKDNSNVVISSLYSHFRRLFYIAVTPDATNAELASLLGCKEFAIKMARSSAKQFSQKKLKTAIELISMAEHDFKTGKINKDNANEQLVLKLLNI